MGLSNPSCSSAPGFNNNATGAHETAWSVMATESRCSRMGSATDRCVGNLALQLVDGTMAMCCQFPAVGTATGKLGAAVEQTGVGVTYCCFRNICYPVSSAQRDTDLNSVTWTRARGETDSPAQFMAADYQIETKIGRCSASVSPWADQEAICTNICFTKIN